MSSLIVLNGYNTIQLTKGQNTLVDEQDWPELSKYNWQAKWMIHVSHYHASRSFWCNGKKIHLRLHRVIMEAVAGTLPTRTQVDHKNLDSLDNRRDNLRIATHGQNQQNSRKYRRKGGETSSQYKGVSWDKNSGRWKAYIQANGHLRHIGLFKSEIEAARAYNHAAQELHGEFARINEGI